MKIELLNNKGSIECSKLKIVNLENNKDIFIRYYANTYLVCFTFEDIEYEIEDKFEFKIIFRLYSKNEIKYKFEIYKDEVLIFCY